AEELLPKLVQGLRTGVPLADLAAAGALANARAYGGTNYNGYHTLMALVPSLEMAAQLPAPLGPVSVLKVLHRHARFLHDSGRDAEDALAPLEASGTSDADLVASVRARDLARAEQRLAVLA